MWRKAEDEKLKSIVERYIRAKANEARQVLQLDEGRALEGEEAEDQMFLREAALASDDVRGERGR